MEPRFWQTMPTDSPQEPRENTPCSGTPSTTSGAAFRLSLFGVQKSSAVRKRIYLLLESSKRSRGHGNEPAMASAWSGNHFGYLTSPLLQPVQLLKSARSIQPHQSSGVLS
jgi:hypothetical protein